MHSREPTKAMIEAGCAYFKDTYADTFTSAEHWRRMYDAAGVAGTPCRDEAAAMPQNSSVEVRAACFDCGTTLQHCICPVCDSQLTLNGLWRDKVAKAIYDRLTFEAFNFAFALEMTHQIMVVIDTAIAKDNG